MSRRKAGAWISRLLVDVQAWHRVYGCGRTRLIGAIEALGIAWPAGVLHYEQFSAEGSGLDPAREHGFVVELRDSQLRLTVPPDRMLLQDLLAAGVDLPCD